GGPSGTQRQARARGAFHHRAWRRHDTPSVLAPYSSLRRTRNSGQAPLAACFAARFRHPPDQSRRRSARGAATARTCRHLDDANLYARGACEAEGAPQGTPPARQMTKNRDCPYFLPRSMVTPTNFALGRMPIFATLSFTHGA